MTSWAPSHIVAPHYILACMSHTQIPARLGPHAPPYERRIDEEVKQHEVSGVSSDTWQLFSDYIFA